MRHHCQILVVAALALFLSASALAQTACPQTNNRPLRPRHQMARQATCPNPRPTRTAAGVPIRWVNVPIPRPSAYYGAYGYGQGYGYGNNYSYDNQGSSGLNRNTNRVRRAPRRQTRSSMVAPDPRSARDYKLRKAMNQFTQDNSLGGRLYVKSDSQKWLLAYDGQPEFSDSTAAIPCRGKLKGGFDQPLTLTLHFLSDNTVEAKVTTR